MEHRQLAVCILLICCYQAARLNAELATVPVSSAAFVTQTIILNCSAAQTNDSDFHPYDWQFNPMNQIPERIVYDCQVNPKYAGKYITEVTEDGGCSLIIPNLKYDSAGTYTCQNGFDQASATIVMLNTNSSCSFSPIDLVSGEEITLFCYLNYNGTISPEMEWRTETGSVINNATTNTYPTQVNSKLVLPVFPPTTRAITCTTFFNPPIEFTFTWTLPAVYIQYEVTDIATTVSGEYCGEYYYANTTNLTCSAKGYPEPSFSWTDLDTGLTYNGSTVTLVSVGLNQFVCRANNEIRDVIYIIEDFVNVTISEGGPTTCEEETTVELTSESETETTITTTTQQPTTTLLSVTNCGSILHVAPNDTTISDGYNLMCYISRADTSYATTQCRNLIQNLPPGIGNADDLVQKGGNYGCALTTRSDFSQASFACFDGYQTSITLNQCSTCTYLFTCIRLPPSYHRH